MKKQDLNIIMILIFVPIIDIFNKYIFNDWQFIISLGVVIVIDTILGFAYAVKSKGVSSFKFIKVIYKFIIYFFVLIATHNVAHYNVNGKENTILLWVDTIMYAVIMCRELISVMENCGKLGIIIPAWILKRLKDFDETGKFTPEEKAPPAVEK